MDVAVLPAIALAGRREAERLELREPYALWRKHDCPGLAAFGLDPELADVREAAPRGDEPAKLRSFDVHLGGQGRRGDREEQQAERHPPILLAAVLALLVAHDREHERDHRQRNGDPVADLRRDRM